ncbi:MAG: putative toxin-antitoxin system toxin component, PIN family [Planctomycetaceae bacterium]|nr:putative toxin-antitoxin system toxin component, PIN family [Planctomycetaceae bacterium]
MRSEKKFKIIVDTNLWISFLLSEPTKQRIRRLLLSDKVDILFSKELFNELETTAKRRKFHKYFGVLHIETLLQMLVEVVEIVDVRSFVNICRDPKDNFLLALAKDGGADYLITGDNDLLALKRLGKTKILTLRDFEKIFE